MSIILWNVFLFFVGYGIGHFITQSKYMTQFRIYRRAGFTVLNSIKRAYKVCK
jgi:hypothetical protein